MRALRALCAALVALATATAVLAEDQAATITGADRVFVRRGPGKEFPAFATVTKGDRVQVQDMEGEWARIETAGGQTGFVRSTYLDVPSARPRAVVTAPVAPTAGSPPATVASGPVTPTVAHKEAAAPQAAPGVQDEALKAEVAALQQEVGDLNRRGEAGSAVGLDATTGGASATPVGQGVTPEDVARLAAAVDAIQRRLEASGKEPGPVASSPERDEGFSASGTTAVAILALIVGWILGATVGRRRERSRRSKIRF